MISRQKILGKTNNRCAHCGRQLNEETMTVEHIFPRHKGGRDDEYNLVALCITCNQEKSNFVHDMYYYPHISIEYKDKYWEYHDKIIEEKYGDRILMHETATFGYLPYKSEELLYKMLKVKPNARIRSDVLRKMTASVEVRTAYPGDAEDIMAVIKNNINSSMCYTNAACYENDVSLLNDIKAKQVYAIYSKGRICGAYCLKKISEFMEMPQMVNAAEELGLELAYVVSGTFIEKPQSTVIPNIVEYFHYRLISMGILPVYFDTRGEQPHDKTEIVVPYQKDGCNGNLTFTTATGIREQLLIDIFDNLKQSRDEELMMLFVEAWLKGIDSLAEKDADKIRADEELMQALNKPKHSFITGTGVVDKIRK